MIQTQLISPGSSSLHALRTQALARANQKKERSAQSKSGRRNQINETLAGLHSEASPTSYSQRLLAFTDR